MLIFGFLVVEHCSSWNSCQDTTAGFFHANLEENFILKLIISSCHQVPSLQLGWAHEENDEFVQDALLLDGEAFLSKKVN